MRQKIKRYPIIVWVDEIEMHPRGASDTIAQVEYSLIKEGTNGAVVAEKKIIDVPVEMLEAFISKDKTTINSILAQKAPEREFEGITIPAMQLEDDEV